MRLSTALTLVTVASSLTQAQSQKPATSAGVADPARKAEVARSPDFKVVYWYERRDPLDTFQFRAYDVRKGEYTSQVDEWLKRVRRDYPHYNAYMKEVVLKPQRGGESPGELLARAVSREHLAVSGPNGGHGVRDAYGLFGGGQFSYPGVTKEPRRSAGLPRIQAVPGAYEPPAYPFPTPFPYPRPHP